MALGIAAKSVVWSARAQIDADAVALAYATSGPQAADRFCALVGARIESVLLNDGLVSVVVAGKWGSAVATAELTR